MESWASCLVGCFFLFQRKSHIIFWYILEQYRFGLWTTVWVREFGLRLYFYLLKRVLFCPRFYYTFTYFVPFEVIENRVTKVNSKYFNENCAEAWIICICVSWITCILLRQLISLKKICGVVSHYLLALMKLASTSAAIIYKSIENRHPWQTSPVRVEGSDRKPFILILDWTLVYTCKWICLHIQNYAKEKSRKSQSTLRILQKKFYSVYLTHQLCNK